MNISFVEELFAIFTNGWVNQVWNHSSCRAYWFLIFFLINWFSKFFYLISGSFRLENFIFFYWAQLNYFPSCMAIVARLWALLSLWCSLRVESDLPAVVRLGTTIFWKLFTFQSYHWKFWASLIFPVCRTLIIRGFL